MKRYESQRYKSRNDWRPGLVGCLMFAGSLLAVAALEDATMSWRWSNPRPHGNNVVAMAWSSAAGLAVQVTERGGLYTSDDLERWIPRVSGTTRALRAVAFLGSRIVITGEAGTVLHADAPHEFQPGELADGPTLDWLEAVATSETLAVAVGDNGAVYTSADGVVWQRENSGVTDWLRGVAHGNGTFVAVGENGTILTSNDGFGWTRIASGTSTDWNRVTHASGLFMAVGDQGLVHVSNNGTDWIAQHSGATGPLYDAVASEEGWLVLGDNEARILEGGIWHDALGDLLEGLPPWIYYTGIGGSGWYLVAGRTGMMVEGFRSGPGDYQWRMASPSVRTWLFDAAWVANLFVAVGDRATVLTSSTGVDWSLESVPLTMTNSIFLGVGGTTNLLVAAGNEGSLMISPHEWIDIQVTNSNGGVVTRRVSSLGILWHAVDPRPTTYDLQGVCHHAGRYYVSGDNGLVLRSEDGTNWTHHLTPTSSFLSGITGFDGGLVASGDDGTLLYSVDGEDWVRVASGTTDWLYRVRAVNDHLLAVGQNGVMLTSTNGFDWVLRDAGTSRWLNDVTWVDGRYFAVGTGGTVQMSTDGVSWTAVGAVTQKALMGATTDGRRLMTVGVEGVILRSSVVPDLTPVTILGFDRVPGEEPDTVWNLFLFGGRVDQRFTLDDRQGFGAPWWNTGRAFEFFDTTGILHHAESGSASMAPPEEYYRATLTP